MAAHSDRQIRELRDAIFLTEQRRSITPEVSILKVKTHNSVTLSALQKELSPAEAVLEYVLDDPASYCLAITRTSVRIAKLRGKAAISADVDSFLKEVKAKHAAQAEARRLYADLIAVVPEAQHQRRLIVVRDGPLHLVPFDALMDSTNRYLVDSRIVTYAPSASSFFLLRCNGPRSFPPTEPNSDPGVLTVFPSLFIVRNGPHRQGSALAVPAGTPLTAPGRSSRSPEMRERP